MYTKAGNGSLDHESLDYMDNKNSWVTRTTASQVNIYDSVTLRKFCTCIHRYR